MGNAESSYEQRFTNKYSFIQAIQDKNYGPIKIYRKRELNFDYVMVLERYFSSSQLHLNKEHLQCIKTSFTREKQPLLLRIFNVEQIQRSNCGGNGLRMYLEYLNFSLKDVIEQKKTSYLSFSIDEIMYILINAIETYQFFKQLYFNNLSIRSDTIFITTEGFIRFSPIKVDDFYDQPDHCDCMNEPTQNMFQKSQRQFIIEIKNLLHQLVSICPRNDQYFYKSHELLSNVNHSRTISHLQSFLTQSNLEGLVLGKKVPQSTEISTIKQNFEGDYRQSYAKSKRSLKESSQAHYY